MLNKRCSSFYKVKRVLPLFFKPAHRNVTYKFFGSEQKYHEYGKHKQIACRKSERSVVSRAAARSIRGVAVKPVRKSRTRREV